jgi:hypothetical protein
VQLTQVSNLLAKKPARERALHAGVALLSKFLLNFGGVRELARAGELKSSFDRMDLPQGEISRHGSAHCASLLADLPPENARFQWRVPPALG